MKDKSDKDFYICSFCGKTEDEVSHIIVGPAVYICNECVELCHKIILDERGKKFRNNARAQLFAELWGTDI